MVHIIIVRYRTIYLNLINFVVFQRIIKMILDETL